MARYANFLTALAAICFASLLTGATANASNPNGTWTWAASGTYWLDLKQEGEKLTGTLTLPSGAGVKLDIKDGSFKNNEASFKAVFERGNRFEFKYQGKVEGDSIKGTTELELNGEMRTRDWEAKRVPLQLPQ